jgi:hypothetical protein
MLFNTVYSGALPVIAGGTNVAMKFTVLHEAISLIYTVQVKFNKLI